MWIVVLDGETLNPGASRAARERLLDASVQKLAGFISGRPTQVVNRAQ